MTATAEIEAAKADLEARIAKCAEQIATGYTRKISTRRGTEEIIFEIAPDTTGTIWELTAVGFDHKPGGRTEVGEAKSRTYLDLDDARAYANRWVEKLTGQGWRITRPR